MRIIDRAHTTPTLPHALGDALHILQNQRRRIIIQHLHDHDPASMDDLSRRIAAHENNTPCGDVTADNKRIAYISLYQTHLPLLDEYSIIEWEHVGDTPITRGSAWPAYHNLLEILHEYNTDDGGRA